MFRSGRKIQNWLAGVMIIVILASGLLSTGCAEQPVIGGINDQATVALINYETLEDGVSGVVYREINRFNAFLAQSKVPVLVVFYSSLASVNSLIIPRLEQMADDFQGHLQIVWIDSNAENALSESFKVETLPQFTVVVDGSLKRSLIGYDDQGAVRLQALLEPYLVEPSTEK